MSLRMRCHLIISSHLENKDRYLREIHFRLPCKSQCNLLEQRPTAFLQLLGQYKDGKSSPFALRSWKLTVNRLFRLIYMQYLNAILSKLYFLTDWYDISSVFICKKKNLCTHVIVVWSRVRSIDFINLRTILEKIKYFFIIHRFVLSLHFFKVCKFRVEKLNYQ